MEIKTLEEFFVLKYQDLENKLAEAEETILDLKAKVALQYENNMHSEAELLTQVENSIEAFNKKKEQYNDLVDHLKKILTLDSKDTYEVLRARDMYSFYDADKELFDYFKEVIQND